MHPLLEDGMRYAKEYRIKIIKEVISILKKSILEKTSDMNEVDFILYNLHIDVKNEYDFNSCNKIIKILGK